MVVIAVRRIVVIKCVLLMVVRLVLVRGRELIGAIGRPMVVMALIVAVTVIVV